MVKSYYFFLALFLLPFAIIGQLFSQEMPVRQIPQITIVESNKKYFSDDQTTHTLDLKSLRPDQHQNLGYILERQSPALIRTYGGAGALTSVSLHGTGSNHTQVSWNGFPLNSPTTGQVDLSLIPSGFIQSVDVINGASGALFGSGTFGGSISLNNEPDWNNRISVYYSIHAGSYGSLGHIFSIRAGRRRFQYQLCGISASGDNNFKYRDHYRYQSPNVKNNHNAYRSFGLVQNIYLNLNHGNHLEAGLWYQQKTMEIPALMGSYKSSHAAQKDSLFRSFVSYRKTTEKSALVVKSAYFSDYLNYTDKINASDTMNSLDSKIATGHIMNEADYRFYLSSKLIFGGGASYNRIMGNSNNYGGKIRENEYAVYGNLKVIVSNIILNVGLRKEFYEGLNPQSQYSFGIRYKPNYRLVLRSGFSSKFRKPTYNEKYWKPGGNPQLRPEKGRGGDLTVEWTAIGDKTGSFWLDTRLTGYFQSVDNWIQWVIRDSLTPVEYKKVQASGLETWIEYGVKSGFLSVNGFINYNFNRSVIVNTYDDNILFEGNQLMYVPLHTLKAGSEARYRNFMLGIASTYIGTRETVESADEYLRLPAFALIDLLAGFQKEVGKVNLALNFRIDNLFDTTYEAIRSYPVPGRTYHFTLTIGLNKTSPDINL